MDVHADLHTVGSEWDEGVTPTYAHRVQLDRLKVFDPSSLPKASWVSMCSPSCGKWIDTEVYENVFRVGRDSNTERFSDNG